MTATDLSYLWRESEQSGCLTAWLIDAVRESGEDDCNDFADCLYWCWKAGRWPGLTIREQLDPMERYFFTCGDMSWDCYSVPFINGAMKQRDTAREAFMDLWREWRKLTIEQKRALLAGEGIR